MLYRIARLAIAAPRRVLAAAVLVFVAATVFGVPVAKNLAAGGLQDPASESAQAAQLLADKFGQSDQQMLVVVTAPDGVTGEHARATGTDIAEALDQSPLVFNVASAWTSPPPVAAALVSTDQQSGLIVVNLKGDESDAQQYATTLTENVIGDRDGVTVRVGGSTTVIAQITQQTTRDLLLMEAIAMPLSFVVLVWVFGGLLAAALPVALGGIAIVGAMSVLRLITFGTDVSIYALNLVTAMGLALAIDYTLLIISRYRDELNAGNEPNDALVQTMLTAGRTVAFSATTVALSMAVMVVFPMYSLRSFAYAGVATIAFVALAAIVVTPAAIVWLGPRLDALDVRRLARRILRRPTPAPKPVQQQFWYRSTRFVLNHAVPVGLAVVALLVFLGTPFLGVKWGYFDDRFLPSSASAHQVGDQLRDDFPGNIAAAATVVIPDADGLSLADLERYAIELSQVPDVMAVSAPTGAFVGGDKTGPPAAATGAADGSAFLTVSSTAPLSSQASETQLDQLHAVPAPQNKPVQIGGLAQVNRDSIAAIAAKLPLVLGAIAAITAVLLFLLTGSAVLPLKALVLNVLSLTATFGALVWIFQQGHLGALGTTPTGTLVANMPVLLFCIAFGLSMDYEVFLISRIREYWLASPQTSADNDESVALGLARTGRVITAAALIMAIAFAALTASQVAFMRMFGLGLTLAVAVDATLVRMVLVPAFMHILDRYNWWAPKPLAHLHNRIGISETGNHAIRPTPAQPATYNPTGRVGAGHASSGRNGPPE